MPLTATSQYDVEVRGWCKCVGLLRVVELPRFLVVYTRLTPVHLPSGASSLPPSHTGGAHPAEHRLWGPRPRPLRLRRPGPWVCLCDVRDVHTPCPRPLDRSCDLNSLLPLPTPLYSALRSNQRPSSPHIYQSPHNSCCAARPSTPCSLPRSSKQNLLVCVRAFILCMDVARRVHSYWRLNHYYCLGGGGRAHARVLCSPSFVLF